MAIFDDTNMHDIFLTKYVYKGFNKQGIKESLEYLRPDNCIISIYSQNHGKILNETQIDSDSEEGESDSDSDNGIEYTKEPWYGTKYTKSKFTQDLVDKLTNPTLYNEQIANTNVLENTLFPERFEIGWWINDDMTDEESKLDDDPNDKIPTKILWNEHMDVWHMVSLEFKVPTVYIIDSFYTNDWGILDTVEGRVFVQIWINVIDEYLREFKYMAEMAKLYFSLSYDNDGIEFYFKGYSDKIEEYVYKWIEKISEFQPEQYESIFMMK